MKKLHKILISIFVILSVCGNIYYFGSQKLNEERAKIYNQGINDGVVSIYNFAKANGFINIRNGEDELTLIVK